MYTIILVFDTLSNYEDDGLESSNENQNFTNQDQLQASVH